MRLPAAKSIRLSGLVKRYDRTQVLHGVDLDVRAGEFMSMLGPSGSGKTTILKIIAGFEAPDSGMVTIGDRDMVGVAPEHRNIGVVFQNYSLFPHMSVAGNIGFPLRMRGMPKARQRTRIEQALELVALPGYGNRMPNQLSGGQQQRVAIARAIVFEPDILLMDEPLGALDRRLREDMQMEIKALHERLGITIVYVTHDQEEALSMSDRIAVFNRGRVEQTGTPREVYRQPATLFVADFLGDSLHVSAAVQDDRIEVADVVAILQRPPAGHSGRVRLLWRCDEIEIAEPVARPAVSGGRITMPATVLSVAYAGTALRLKVQLASGEIGTVAAPEGGRAETGGRIGLRLDLARATILPDTARRGGSD
ncbi:MAG: polyamine-transporting ATPase [Alphaproteobacteria bacterium]|nr:MAG: polyamine-transporting ATPase [Alphaproteobacteria bacterium]